MRKAILPLILCFLLLFSGCSGNAGTSSQSSAVSDGKISIVTSFYPVWLLAQSVIGDTDAVILTNMAPAQSGCLHDYTLTMNDLKLLERADLFLINGSGMEGFAEQVADAFPALPTVSLTEGETLLHGADCEHTHNGDHDHDHGTYNAHLWMSPAGAAAMAGHIADALGEIDPANAETYRANADALSAELEEIRSLYAGKLANKVNPHIVIFHESFAYLADALGLEVVGVIAKEPDEEPTARELTDIIRIVNEYGVTALFTDSQYDDRAALTVAAETDAVICELDSLVNEPDNDVVSFAERLRANCKAIVEALESTTLPAA